MISRRRALAAICACVAAAVVRAQSTNNAPRIGFLDPAPAKDSQPRVANLRKGLARLGLIERKHYVLEYRSAEGQFDRLPALAVELAGLPVRVIVSRNTPGTLAARQATRSIPIVMADVGDPVELGFVQSLARPGGNITGLSNITLELLRKRLELLLDALPGTRRVAVIGNSGDQNTKYQISEVQSAAKRLQVELRIFDARSAAEIDPALRAVEAWKPDAVLTLVHPIYRAMFSPRIVAWSRERRIAVMHAFREEVEAGGLIAYAADLSDHYERVASYVARLLNGADPATLPVERPTRIELILNPQTALAIGVTFPQSILARADRIVE